MSKFSPAAPSKKILADSRTDRDASQLDKLRQLGLGANDEIKLELLREHIVRLAASRRR